jgi:hypothetical protein
VVRDLLEQGTAGSVADPAFWARQNFHRPASEDVRLGLPEHRLNLPTRGESWELISVVRICTGPRFPGYGDRTDMTRCAREQPVCPADFSARFNRVLRWMKSNGMTNG